METLITYSDIIIEPQESSVSSRSNVDLSTNMGRFTLSFPVISANMPDITGPQMAAEIRAFGGMGILARGNSFEQACAEFKLTCQLIKSNLIFNDIAIDAEIDEFDSNHPDLSKHIKRWLKTKLRNITFNDTVDDEFVFANPVGVAIGVKDQDKERFQKLYEAGARIFCVDVNHGHHKNVHDMISWARSQNEVVIIAGNIATAHAAEDLQEWGADILKVGVGPGEVCMTRRNTGVGVPQVSALQWVNAVAKVPTIADGGIKYPGDCTKALALGSDAIMVGSYLAGTSETPGKVFRNSENKLYKVYGGNASGENKNRSGNQTQFVEGIMKTVGFNGHVKHILREIRDGLQSGFSLSGADNLKEFQQKVKWNRISKGSQMESKI